ncbi:MAG: leucine-rich repeat protein [Oscillospiraceae bacterium]
MKKTGIVSCLLSALLLTSTVTPSAVQTTAFAEEAVQNRITFQSNDTLFWDSIDGASYYRLTISVDGGEPFTKTTFYSGIDDYYTNDGVIQSGDYYILIDAVFSDETTRNVGILEVTIGAYSDGTTTFYYKTNADGTYTIITSDFSGGELTLPSAINDVAVTGLGHGSFDNAGITGSLVIPEGVKNIYGAAFSRCLMTELTLPDSLEYLDGFAFEHCSNLRSVVIPKNVTNIVWNPFISAASLTEIGCSEDNTAFTSVDGVLYDKAKEVLYICPAAKSGEFVVPTGVKHIHNFAFCGAENITSVELCEGLETIGSFAFAGCGFTSVTVPDSVTSIEWNSLGYNANGEKLNGFTIIGGKGSAAEQYATDNGFEFVEYVENVVYDDVELTEENFPDPVFRQYISAFDVDPTDNVLSDGELKNITNIDLPSSGVTSLKGIELLPALIRIDCSDNPISSIDISKNTKLQILFMNECALASLDVSANKSLRFVSAGYNVFDHKIIDGAVSLDELPADFDIGRVTFIGNSYYDSDSRTIRTDSDFISYYYDIGNNGKLQFIITDRSAPVSVIKSEKINISPSTAYKGQYVYVSVMLNDFVGHRLLVNGSETELLINGDGIRWGTSVPVNTDSLTLTLEECEWTEEQMSELVTIKCSDDVELHPYNSYYGSIISNYTVQNGDYFSRNHILVLMLDPDIDTPQPFLINGKSVIPELLNERYTAFYNIPADVTELDISVDNDSVYVPVTKSEGISIYPSTVFKGQYVYVSVPLNDFVGHRLLVNGSETEPVINGDGVVWGTSILADTDTLTLTLEECEWTEEQLSELVTIKCSNDVELHPYNSYLNSIISYYTVNNGEYFSKNHKLVLMSEELEGFTKKFLINGEIITPELSDGKYTAFYDIPAEATELNINVIYETESEAVYFGSNDCLCWNPVESASGYEISVSVDGEYAYSLYPSWSSWDYFLEQNAPIRLGNYQISVYALFTDAQPQYIGSIEVKVESAKIGENTFYYKTNSDGCYTIVGAVYGTKDVVIPGYINDVQVTEIGQASLWFHNEIENVTISEGVKKVQGKSFLGCENLKTITLPDSLERVDGFAFQYCSSVTSMTIPKNVSYIVWSPFNEMASLTEINCAAENEYYTSVDGVLFTKDMTAVVAYPVGRKGAYTVPETVRYIEPYVFSGAKYLTEINILGSIEGINNGAFDGCQSLNSVVINEGVKYVGCYAFSGCTGIKSFYVPESVTNIGDGAFGFSDPWTLNPDFYLSGKEGSMIEAYAFRYGIPFNPVGTAENDPFDNENSQSSSVDGIDGDILATPPVNIQDKENGSFDFGSYFFSVSKITDLEKEEAYQELLQGKDSDTVHFLDFDLTDEEGTSHGEDFTGLIMVDIPYPLEQLGNGYGRYHLYRMTENGIEEIPGKHVSISGSHFYRVYLEHFSDYALVETEDVSSAACVSHSILLGDDIGVRFYMELTGEFASEQSKMVFTVSGKQSEMTVADAEKTVLNGKEVYVFTCHVAAAEMADSISAQVVCGKTVSEAITYSVQEYASYILANQGENAEFAKAAPLVKAMLNYGTYAQLFFNHNSESLANAGLSENEKLLTEKSSMELSGYKYNVTDSDADIDFVGQLLTLKNKVTVRLYFTDNSDGAFDISDFTVTSGGAAVDKSRLAVGSDTRGQYLVISGIGAGDFDRAFEISVGDVTISNYSVFSYIRQAVNNADSKLVNVARAMYDYNRSVENYLS